MDPLEAYNVPSALQSEEGLWTQTWKLVLQVDKPTKDQEEALRRLEEESDDICIKLSLANGSDLSVTIQSKDFPGNPSMIGRRCSLWLHIDEICTIESIQNQPKEDWFPFRGRKESGNQ